MTNNYEKKVISHKNDQKEHDEKKKRVKGDDIKVEVSSWIDLMPEKSNADNLQPEIPFGYVDNVSFISQNNLYIYKLLQIFPFNSLR